MKFYLGKPLHNCDRLLDFRARRELVESIFRAEDGHEEAVFEEQIIGFKKQAEVQVPVKEPCRRQGFSDAPFEADPAG